MQEQAKQFEPIGEEAQWKPLYKAVKDAEIDHVFTWADLRTITGLDVQERREVIYIANKELLKDNKKMLINVRGKGYKVCPPDEQLNHASNRKTRGCRQFKKGILEVQGLDTKKMSQEEKINAAHLLNHLQMSLRTVRKRNVDALEKTKVAVQAQEGAVSRIDEIMEELLMLKGKLKE